LRPVRSRKPHPVVRPGGHWIYPCCNRWLGFAHGKNDRAVALPDLQL
jgi:hypothetical protein